MALIRHAEAEKIARDAIVLDLGDVRAQAELILSRAESQASRTLMEARAERERIIAGAHEQGLREGTEQGHAEGLVLGAERGRADAKQAREAELQQIERSWADALESFNARRDAMLDDARDALIALACRIASRVTHRVIEADPGVVVDQVRESVSMVMGASRLVVEVSPACHDLVRSALPGVMASLGSSAHTEVRTDESLSPGSCVVRSAAGVIDASIETQLDRIAEALAPSQGPRPAEATT